MTRLKSIKWLSFILIFILSIAFISCNSKEKSKTIVTEGATVIPVTPSEEKTPTEEIILEKEQYNIMVGTTEETTVYVFRSNVSGPTVFITGGTHGDELAGWHAALRLLDRTDYRGTVIIIPKLDAMGCKLEQRYPGINNGGMHDGIAYSNLNRVFPGDPNGNVTQKLAYEITQEIAKYNPDYIVDLHESRSSYSTDTGSLLGDQLLYGNARSALLCEDLVEIYNRTKAEEGDVPFGFDGPGVAGSLNNYYGMTLKVKGFTIETNRKLDLSKRIKQQLDLMDVFFNYIWFGEE